tara:strand:- start:723 stop:1067 length:345 start_codon:yes stop_codon:yes gene_type:complete
VLPAILNSSTFLQNKYSKPIYGASDGIPSLNFKDWQWIKIKDGKVTDPYKMLPKMFQDISGKDMDILSDDDELRDGGSALTAYARSLKKWRTMSVRRSGRLCSSIVNWIPWQWL